MKHILELLEAERAFPDDLIQSDTLYTRMDDMGGNVISVVMQPDGDIGVSVYGGGLFGNKVMASAEFCFPGSGGGTSPLVRKALLLLACAIAEENKRPELAGGRADA